MEYNKPLGLTGLKGIVCLGEYLNNLLRYVFVK